MKTLIVAEKPSVAREFARALGARWSAGESRDGHYESDEWLVTFCLGHMMRMKDPEEYREEWRRWTAEPIRPERFEKSVIPATAAQAERVIALIARDDVAGIVNAGDAGREGEGIQRELYEEAFRRMGREKPVRRFWTSEALTRDAILSGLKRLRDASEFDGLYRAFLARERADWIVGLSATRAYTSTFARGGKQPLSIGRVQTPVLALVVRREEEIENFKTEGYATVHGRRGKEGDEERIDARAVAPADPRGDRFAFWDRALAQRVADECRGKPFKVEKIEEKTKREFPPRLFSMPALQERANKIDGQAPDRTLALAQSLYEKRFLTYPRTDSEHLGASERSDAFVAPRAAAAARHVPGGAAMRDAMLPISETGERIFADHKVTDHHAIVPTDLSDTAVPFERLDEDERRLFLLVAERFLVAFLPPAVYGEGEAELTCGPHRFVARARRTLDPGWTAFQPGKKQAEGRLRLAEGETLELSVSLEAHETTPPKRFTLGEIIHAMTHAHKHLPKETAREIVEALKEADGIGTGATRDSFVPLLERRGYVEVKRNVVLPLPRGRDLIGLLAGRRIADFAWTAAMEKRLREMAHGNDPAELERFVEQAYADACELSEAARALAATRKVDGGVIRNTRADVKTLGTCPSCGGDVIRGKQAFGCSNWRNGCKFTLWPDTLAPMGKENLTDRDVAALLKGKTSFKFERKGGGACLRPVELAQRDDGKWFAKVDREAEAVPESLGTCPVEGCGGAVVDAPKSFGCSRWREGCKFALWKDSLEKLGGPTLDRTKVKALLKGDTYLKFKHPSGPVSEKLCRIEPRGDRFGVKVDFEAEAKAEVIGPCPRCGGSVTERPKSFTCAGNAAAAADGTGGAPPAECRFALWKDALAKRGGPELKKTHVKKLLAGKEVAVTLKRPDKTKVDAVCRLDPREGLVVAKAP